MPEDDAFTRPIWIEEHRHVRCDRALGADGHERSEADLVDGTAQDAGAAYRTVRAELDAYGHGLRDKPEVVALNKSDALSPQELKHQLARLRRALGSPARRGGTRSQPPVRVISAATGAGVQDMLRALLAEIDAGRAAEEAKLPAPQWLP